MKKLIPIILCFLLLFSGCGLAEQARTVKTEYFDPAIEAARTGEPAAEPVEAGPSVVTNKSLLTDYVPAETVYTRLSPSAVTVLAPSASYGRLLPFVGACVYDEDGGVAGQTFGLVTEDGKIVLDSVLDELRQASYYAVDGELTYLDIYILGEKNAQGEMTYALCGTDGAWATEFLYATVIPMELGVLCIVDEARNSALCIGEDGSTVFDTSRLEAVTMLKPGTVAELAGCSGGFMAVSYANGQFGFMDAQGGLLNRYADMPSYFDSVSAFSDGLAAVSLNGRWGYLQPDGDFLLNLEYDSAAQFVDGLGVVSQDGVTAVVGTDGVVKKQFTDVSSVVVEKGFVTVTDAQGGVSYLRTDDLEPMTMYEYDGIPFRQGYWVKGANGVRAIVYGVGEVYFSGGEALKDAADGLYLVALADGTEAVMDKDSRVVAAGRELSFVKDCSTGETYVVSLGEDGADVYSAAGKLIVTGAADGEGLCVPTDGLVMCREGSATGWKNSSDQWVFRIRLDAGD